MIQTLKAKFGPQVKDRSTDASPKCGKTDLDQLDVPWISRGYHFTDLDP